MTVIMFLKMRAGDELYHNKVNLTGMSFTFSSPSKQLVLNDFHEFFL